jgi:hypothetical protein
MVDPDIVVGVVNATDEDLGNNGIITYSIISIDVKHLFNISQVNCHSFAFIFFCGKLIALPQIQIIYISIQLSLLIEILRLFDFISSSFLVLLVEREFKQ